MAANPVFALLVKTEQAIVEHRQRHMQRASDLAKNSKGSGLFDLLEQGISPIKTVEVSRTRGSEAIRRVQPIDIQRVLSDDDICMREHGGG